MSFDKLTTLGGMAVKRKAVYTTGDAAEICNLSQQTIIRCFDSGQLQGFRVPGSKFRRVPHEALIKFMKEHGIPLDVIEDGRVKVLVVDDDPDVILMFVDILGADGRFRVETASTGYDAGVMTQRLHPDVLVLDYMLPDVNGNVVCKTIRENPELAGTKILIISGVVNPSEIDKLKAAGADDFVKKPFNMEHFIDRILELAGRK